MHWMDAATPYAVLLLGVGITLTVAKWLYEVFHK
jgi:hypothetical protein